MIIRYCDKIKNVKISQPGGFQSKQTVYGGILHDDEGRWLWGFYDKTAHSSTLGANCSL